MCQVTRIISPLTCETLLDDDLAAMYLSDKKRGVERSPTDHEELEVLLESFTKQVEEIVNESETIAVCIRKLNGSAVASLLIICAE